MKTEVKYAGQLNFIDLLTLAFIVLKLTGVIDWSWVWVLSPIWILVIIAVIAGIIVLSTKSADKR